MKAVKGLSTHAAAAGDRRLRRGLLDADPGGAHVPVGVAYAVWAGMGIVMVSVAALFIYGQKLDVPAMLGMGLIVLGVVVIQLFSKPPGTDRHSTACILRLLS
jgi:drug/metabolite transporter (DMT)-like permease